MNPALSVREKELLVLLGRGASLKGVSAALNIAYKTADNRKMALMRKLGIHDRVQLARYAIRNGFVTADETDDWASLPLFTLSRCYETDYV